MATSSSPSDPKPSITKCQHNHVLAGPAQEGARWKLPHPFGYGVQVRGHFYCSLYGLPNPTCAAKGATTTTTARGMDGEEELRSRGDNIEESWILIKGNMS